MNTQFFSKNTISKIVILFSLAGVVGIGGFAYVTKHNQGRMPSEITVVQAPTKNIGAYVHIRKPGENGFRKFDLTDI